MCPASIGRHQYRVDENDKFWDIICGKRNENVLKVVKNGKARSSIAVEAREEHGGEHRKKIEVLFKDLLQEFGICYCEKRQKKGVLEISFVQKREPERKRSGQ